VITSALAKLASEAGADRLVDVVVELSDDPDAEHTVPARRESFETAAEPVTQAIAELGGSVTDKAWINRTLRAQVPAARLPELNEHESVTALDAPRAIELD
jgi:hypothetical protein